MLSLNNKSNENLILCYIKWAEFNVVVTSYCAIKLKQFNSLSIRPRFLTPHEGNFLLIYISETTNLVCWGIYRSSEQQATGNVCP